MILLDLFCYPPRFSMSVPCVALMSELFYVLRRIGWLSILLLYSRVSYCFYDD
jgi:hypothetical protein